MKKIAFLILFVVAGVSGCKSKSDVKAPQGDTAGMTGMSGTTPASANLVMPGDAVVGDTTTCLASGETFVVTAESPKATHEGKTYYFCCPGCEKKFSADPATYLAKMPAPAPMVEPAPAPAP